ncbi:MAG: ATP-binding cassette domain-containing protein [Alphaproteobacteria bacterium]|jgi:tungstate transport system ATP-binding protein|nr:ATP-binding cassette domain-containing protein [Alphaproteobacteria bacterium]MBT5256250.1 ATP-binding cassette domain-containing protein [Alphaproteobacteria bacterium]MBT5482614.1 ATP-binding cassette domain-containing protein [Alphaproteobacteria bacterium]MBT5728085.1 ATP-binding cassette domain-containing protein [Alphaproteobacteria bacterium]HAD73006.1 ABC transporter [Alphaproteobacteria bacterium]|tara:strand:+ start:337 stop:999 length:663 start_codon:yes stop_codon:yes gene_type:complete
MSCLIANEVSVIREEHYLLKDISLEIKPATITLILGHNGAGKTLLMQVLHGLTLPDEGVIDSPPASRQRMVFQKPIMLRRTALQYFNFVCPGLSIPDQHHWFDSAQLTSRMDAPARRLSGGEQQKLALIGALAAQPEILFLDEPAASLDVEATMLSESLISEACDAGTTIIMTSHNRAQAARLADQVIFMDQGCVKEQSDAKTFFRAPQSDAGRHYLAFT